MILLEMLIEVTIIDEILTKEMASWALAYIYPDTECREGGIHVGQGIYHGRRS